MSTDLVGILSALCADAVAFVVPPEAELERILDAHMTIKKNSLLSLCLVNEGDEMWLTANGGMISVNYLKRRITSTHRDERCGVTVYGVSEYPTPIFIDMDTHQVWNKFIFPSNSSVHVMGALDSSFELKLSFSHASAPFEDVCQCVKDGVDEHKYRVNSKIGVKAKPKCHKRPSMVIAILSRYGVIVSSLQKSITYYNSFHILPDDVKDARRNVWRTRSIISK